MKHNVKYVQVYIRKDVYYKLKELVELIKKIDIVKNYGDDEVVVEELDNARRYRYRSKYSMGYWADVILEKGLNELIPEKKIELYEAKKQMTPKANNPPDAIKIKKLLDEFKF